MLETTSENQCPIIDPRDAEYIDSMPDPAEREAAICALAAYRRDDRLKAGDPVPELDLFDLSDLSRKHLAAPRDCPLVLFFGSYT